jgi:hypothetical protein
MAISRESTFGVVTEVGLRLVLSQVSESGPRAPSLAVDQDVGHPPVILIDPSEAKGVEEPAFDHLQQVPIKRPNATRVWAPVQLGCRWSRSTPVRMIFYSSLDVMRLPVNRKPPGWSTQFSPCKLHEEPSPVPARLFGPVRCNRRLSLCSATLPVESEAKA